MVEEAEQWAAEDQSRREKVDLTNACDALANQVGVLQHAKICCKHDTRMPRLQWQSCTSLTAILLQHQVSGSSRDGCQKTLVVFHCCSSGI